MEGHVPPFTQDTQLFHRAQKPEKAASSDRKLWHSFNKRKKIPCDDSGDQKEKQKIVR
jgi:hypothetical protein